ncbi:hypothetical protein [Sphingobium sp. HWE2-09]|uniref:hypothetical protein n=1 Tax=Sphingobium sp. HWE2-09 TaxID=3108390 RepID=UPI002DC18566|nr:hypothetical protein [Sphingobium sp. HWE2-09]
MGSNIRSLIIAAPLLLAAPVHAQQTEAQTPGFQLPPSSATPAPNPNQQGPELNVYRDPVTPRTAPPVVVPPVVAPIVTPPAATVQPTPQPSRPRPAPATETPRADRPADRQDTQTPRSPAPAQTAPAEPAPDTGSTPAAEPPAQPLPAPAPDATPEPAATPAPATEEASPTPWAWIIGGVLALAALATVFLMRRRKASATPVEQPAEPTRATPPVPVVPAVPAASVEPPPAAPEPAAALHLPVAATTANTDRPWIDMDMHIAQARFSLMGVTIAYRLTLHNRGDRAAQEILVRGVLGNGGAQQQALLESFFAGQDGLPLHTAVTIAAGETRQLTGELRLSPDQIMPVTMGQRSLLIPLAAFDAAYRWGAEEGEADGQPVGQGRTARAFIVGQEQDPPADRLAPLRLDQGPRQFRRPAARAAAELTPA